MRAALLAIAFSALSGCSWLGYKPEPWESNLSSRDPVKRCASAFAAIDEAVAQQGVRDAAYQRIDGFPYLRVNRFLASYRNELGEGMRFAEWLRRAQKLDQDARHIEMANLTASARQRLIDRFQQKDLDRLVAYCGEQIMTWDMNEHDRREKVLEAAQVDDDYSLFARIVGIYPLTSQIFKRSVKTWHNETRKSFNAPLPVSPGVKLTRYIPKSVTADNVTIDIASMLKKAKATNRLSIPELSQKETDYLLDLYAPIWEVQTASEADKIGIPAVRHGRLAAFDYHQPVTYRMLSYTRFGNDVLVQLNYFIWFSQRPKLKNIDPYAGVLDGIIWRVTLDRDGMPLVYDTIHQCGCYHMTFLTERLRARKLPSDVESPLVFPGLAEWRMDRAVVTISAGTHFVVGFTFGGNKNKDVFYAMKNYNELRSLSQGEGQRRRSLFGEDGIVAGTERGEGLFLWPAGIPSPGSMRQWGKHATAFIGKRYFDEGRLLDELFMRVGVAQ